MTESRYGRFVGHRFAVLAPCIFTVGRIACGFFVVIFTFSGALSLPATTRIAAFDYAAIAIGVALICDSLDGKVARLFGSASALGVQLDSLADVVTFGMAPAVLSFYWGVLPVLQRMDAQSGRILSMSGWLACCAFVVCTVFRLARFNLSAQHTEAGPRRFVGLPAPGAAAVIAAEIHFAKRPLNEWGESVIWLALVTVLALLMVSRIRYETSSWIPVRLRSVLLGLPAGVFLMWAVWAHSGPTLLAIAIVFMLSGPFTSAVSALRRYSRAVEE
jgi:CDP-diacylglycerol---serine O-phosphatidyltransferase